MLHLKRNISFYLSSYKGTNIINTSLIIVSKMETKILFYSDVKLETSIATNQKCTHLHVCKTDGKGNTNHALHCIDSVTNLLSLCLLPCLPYKKMFRRGVASVHLQNVDSMNLWTAKEKRGGSNPRLKYT